METTQREISIQFTSIFIFKVSLVKNARLAVVKTKEKLQKYKTPQFEIIIRLLDKEKKIIKEKKTDPIPLQDSLMFYQNEFIKL